MKKALLGLVALAACLMFASAPAVADISASAHNFSGQGWGTTEICKPCHTPHGGTASFDAPLWNHELSTETYTLYSSSTLQATIDQPNTVGTHNSRLCLSCHDGTVALDSFGGATGTNFITGDANVGDGATPPDLSNDHPIAFTYDSTLAGADGELVDPAADGDVDANTVGAAAPYLPLYSGELECATCHDPHGTSGEASLLRISNAASDLCLKCHLK